MGFERVVVGVGGSEPGFEALRQALLMRSPDGALQAVTVIDDLAGVQAGFGSVAVAKINMEAHHVRDEVIRKLEGLPNCKTRLIHGVPAKTLVAVAREERADVLAIGGRRRSRAAGMFFAGTMSTVLHDAPCSVLLATMKWGEEWYPRQIVVGLDGSSYSLEALAVAEELAARFDSRVSTLAALGGKLIAKEGEWASQVDEWSEAHPVDALDDTSVTADLIVIGSRGRHGIRALGSVGERVAHRARCSVLLVRAQSQPSPVETVELVEERTDP